MDRCRSIEDKPTAAQYAAVSRVASHVRTFHGIGVTKIEWSSEFHTRGFVEAPTHREAIEKLLAAEHEARLGGKVCGNG